MAHRWHTHRTKLTKAIPKHQSLRKTEWRYLTESHLESLSIVRMWSDFRERRNYQTVGVLWFEISS